MHGYLVGMLIQIKLGKSIFEHALLKREMSCWLEIGHCHYSLVEIESSFVLCGGYLLIQSLWRKRTKLQASMNWHEVTNFVPLNIFFSPFPAGDDRGWRGGRSLVTLSMQISMKYVIQNSHGCKILA